MHTVSKHQECVPKGIYEWDNYFLFKGNRYEMMRLKQVSDSQPESPRRLKTKQTDDQCLGPRGGDTLN